MRYARIVRLFADGFFYAPDTYQLISQGVADMHCLSDEYPADELLMEWQHPTPLPYHLELDPG